ESSGGHCKGLQRIAIISQARGWPVLRPSAGSLAELRYSNMSIIHVDTLADPRLDAYRNLKDRELAAMGDLFIAEGEHVVRRLLASGFPVESVLLARRRVEELAPLVPAGVPVYAVSD